MGLYFAPLNQENLKRLRKSNKENVGKAILEGPWRERLIKLLGLELIG